MNISSAHRAGTSVLFFPTADGPVSLEWDPRHVNGVVSANGDAVLFAAAGVRVQQVRNPVGHIQGPGTASLNAESASSASLRRNNRHPFV